MEEIQYNKYILSFVDPTIYTVRACYTEPRYSGYLAIERLRMFLYQQNSPVRGTG